MYASVADLRNEGVTEASASDARLQALLAEATETIDHLTGWFFEPRELEIRLDGRGQAYLEPSVVPIELDELWVEGVRIDENRFRAWGAPVPARFVAPRIVLLGARFPVGEGNVFARGTWGYTEDDGTLLGRTPWAIRRACMLLVVRNLPPVGDQDAVHEVRNRWKVVEERTRDQAYRLASIARASAPLSGDEEVDQLLLRYMRPLELGAV